VLRCHRQFPQGSGQIPIQRRDNLVYPKGFADELNHQIVLLENVTITDEEIDL
jgi:nicotinate phosphoribosyltransferase